MDEAEARAAVVSEAMSWIGTPYLSNGLIKGRQGGTDCAMLLIGVYANVGLIPHIDPRPYSPTWHLHRNEEAYMGYVLQFAKQIPGPPKPADVVMFKLGKVFAHGSIVVQWPWVIHAIGNMAVLREDVSKNTIGKRALWNMPRQFYSIWTS